MLLSWIIFYEVRCALCPEQGSAFHAEVDQILRLRFLDFDNPSNPESGLQVVRLFADLVNRTDKRYPPNGRDNVCVFFWTKRSEIPKFQKVGKDNKIWSDILLKLCKVHEEDVFLLKKIYLVYFWCIRTSVSLYYHESE